MTGDTISWPYVWQSLALFRVDPEGFATATI